MISGLLPIGKTKAYATTEDDIVIYQDGVEYVFTLDDDMNIIIEAETDAGNQAAACIEQDGDFEFETTSKEGDVLFSGTINELTAQTIDAEVKNDDGQVVATYTDIEQIDAEDSYTGQTELLIAQGITITFEQVLSALISAGIALVVSSLTYIVAAKFISKVNNLSSANRAKAKELYYKAYINKKANGDSDVFLHHKGMKITAAANYINAKKTNNVYSFTATTAKAVISKAGHVAVGSEIHNSGKTYGRYYRHYHPKISGTRPHSFYGTGQMGTLWGGNIG